MKLVKRQKGVATIRLQSERARVGSIGRTVSKRQAEKGFVNVPDTRGSFADYQVECIIAEAQAKKAREIAYTPHEARMNGRSYQGPEMADKGQRDGSCNRTACQVPLAGQPRWSMDDHRGGRLYYCQRCVDLFHESDRQFRQPLRCTIIEADL